MLAEIREGGKDDENFFFFKDCLFAPQLVSALMKLLCV